jgi:hypothetical protein
MSLSKFNGKVVLSATNLADISSGAKTSWNATFSFVDNSGVYLGTQIAIGDVVLLDTSAADLGTVTVYAVTSIVSSTFNSFRVTMTYLSTNANPGGAPDVSSSVDLPGLVARRSVLKSLVTIPNSSIQLLPEAFTVAATTANFDIVEATSSATSLAGGSAGVIPYQSAANTTSFTAAGNAGQLLTSAGLSSAPYWSALTALTVGTATNIAGGTAGSLVIQTGPGATSTLSPGATGTVLTSTGTTSAPTWQTLSATTQAYGDATTNIATTAFVDRLRSSPTSTNATALVADRGRTIAATAGVTIPANVFTAGDNNSAASITLTSGAGLTLWLVGTATTGNRTLAQRGIATIYYVSATEAVITGGGLT